MASRDTSPWITVSKYGGSGSIKRGGYTRGSTSHNMRPNSSNSHNMGKSIKDILQKEEVDDIHTSPVCEIILTVENADLKWFADPNYVASRYLEPNCHYPLKGSNNSRPFYEAILSETQSVEFEHFYKGGDNAQKHSPFSFSKASFKKMMTSNDWGLDPNRPRQMQGYPHLSFTYWDYKDAWTNCFYYQNMLNKHTWFFRFSQEFLHHDIPNWCFSWWEKFGPKDNILPPELYSLFLDYKSEKFQTLEGNDIPMFNLFIKYQLPWIWTWNYNTRHVQGFNKGLPSLIRQFKYKWWNKFQYDEIAKQLAVDIQQLQKKNQEALKAKEKVEIKDPLKTLKMSLKKKYPQASKDKIQKLLLELAEKSDDENDDNISDISMPTNSGKEEQDETPEEFMQEIIRYTK